LTISGPEEGGVKMARAELKRILNEKTIEAVRFLPFFSSF